MREWRVPAQSPGVQFQSVNLPDGRFFSVQTSRGPLHQLAIPGNCDGHSARTRGKSGRFCVLVDRLDFMNAWFGRKLEIRHFPLICKRQQQNGSRKSSRVFPECAPKLG